MASRFRRRLRQLERRLTDDEDPTFVLIQYHSDEERDRKIAALPPRVKPYVVIPYECKTIEEWQAEVDADEAKRRAEREREEPPLRLIAGSNKP